MATVNYGCLDAVAHDTMHLRIAGWSIGLRFSPPGLAPALSARCQSFQGPATAHPDLLVEVLHESSAAVVKSGVNSESLLQARLTPNGDDYLLDSGNAYGMIASSRGRAALRLRSAHPLPEVEYFLRTALALFALSRDGLLIHCAALKRSDRVYLFVGQSGSGKSTVVALSRAAGLATALGDDLIVVRRNGADLCAYGTPFWNVETASHEGEHETGPVAGIYKLIQDRQVFVEPASRASATAELVANCPVVNGATDLLPALIERCQGLAAAVGMARLHFRKDASFWGVIG